MDEDLKKLIETSAAEARRHFEVVETRFEETRRHVDAQAEETRRHFDVVADGLRTAIATVAEGVVHCNERIGRVETRVDQLATDMAKEFNDVRSMIKFSHHELERRLRTLEDVVTDLQSRVERLESSTH